MVFFESIVARFLYNINFNQKDFGSLNGWKEGEYTFRQTQKSRMYYRAWKGKVIENLYGTPMEFSS
jgi:hypothetical protein